MECVGESPSDMEELSESQKGCTTEEVDSPCLTEEGVAVFTGAGGQTPLTGIDIDNTDIAQQTGADVAFDISQSFQDDAKVLTGGDSETQVEEKGLINHTTASQFDCQLDSSSESQEPSESQVESNKDEVYFHYVTDSHAVFLAGTDDKNHLDAISQQTGADVQFDHKPSVVENTNLIIIRGSRHQIEEALRRINNMTITEINLQGLSVSENERSLENLTGGHTEEISFNITNEQAAFLVGNMWLTEAIKEQTGIRIQFNAAISGSQLQIYETLKILRINMGTQISEPGWCIKDSNGSAGSQTNKQTAFLYDIESEDENTLTAITQQTGSDAPFDSKPPVEEDSNVDTVRDFPSQLKIKPENLLVDVQNFWLRWVEDSFPDLDSRTYFLPPVYVNRVPKTTQSIAGQDVLVLSAPEDVGQSNQSPRVQESDIRDDAAMQRVLFCLQKMSENNGEVMVGLSQLKFGQYLGEPCYAAAAAQLPSPANLPSAVPQNWKRGEFDVLVIHRQYGLVIVEVKSFGHNLNQLSMSQQDIDKITKKKLKQAMSQLNKGETMLSHLVSDIAPDLRISKTIAFPNLTAHQLLRVISGDKRLSQDLCHCLGASDPSEITGLCLCSDHLSDPKTPWDVSSDVLRELGNWWQRRVAGAGPDSHMTVDVYKALVARFCGPATTVTVPCTSPSRLCIKTMDQAVSLTAQCYTALITLFPEQVNLLNAAPSRLFLAGPPGTGKTVLLLLMALEWCLCDHDVYIVSTWFGGDAVCSMLHHVLEKIRDAEDLTHGLFFLEECDFADADEDVTTAVTYLANKADEGSLYVIADEAGSEFSGNKFRTFCNELSKEVPKLHLWAASCYHGDAPDGWQVECLTRPLRSPPVVVREVEQDAIICEWHEVQPYVERGVPDHTDGPPIIRLYHKGEGHSSRWPAGCVSCGHEVAKLLYSLRVGAKDNASAALTTVTSSSSGTTPPSLQWRDVFVLHSGDQIEELGIVAGLEEMGVPVQVIHKKDKDIDYDDKIKDLAMADSDVVWVANKLHVRGLEKKIVICLKQVSDLADRLHSMSRCTSQLVIVSR